jgi:hypothetical protein
MRIEHELGERAVQTGQLSAHQGKARAGDFRGGGEVELAERFAEIDVILDGKVKDAWRAPAFDFDVVGFGFSDRHALVGQVGQQRQEGIEFLEQLAEADFVGFQFALQRRHLRHHRRGVFTAALEHADLLGEAVAAGLQILGAGLQGLALAFEVLESRSVEYETAPCQAFGKGIDVAAQVLDVEHAQSSAWRSRGAIRPLPLLPQVRRTAARERNDVVVGRSAWSYFSCLSCWSFFSCFCFVFCFSFARRSSSRSCASFSPIRISRPRSTGRYHSTAGMPSGK